MASADYTGETLDDRYHVDKLVGRGGMGKVYLGRHARVGRKVAIKILNAELARDGEIVKRFFREARAAAAIGHRNIIDVLDVGVTADGDPYLVMEYLEGESLAGLITRSGTVNLGAACGIVSPVLQALHAAHKAGIVHRDLKPENIFLSYPQDGPPEVKLIDFGISKMTQEAQGVRLTDTGQLLGTPAYMAPEQAEDSGNVDQRADIYAVGVILYELLTGKLPFDGATHYELFAQILRGKAKPPAEANPEFPTEAEPVVLRAMARNPKDRYPDAAAMLEDIRKLSAFTERGEKLQLLASGVFKPTLPQGGLGGHDSPKGEPTADAKAMLAGIVEQGTPSRWASSSKHRRPAWSKWLAVPAVVLVGAIAWLGVRAMWGGSADSGAGDGSARASSSAASPGDNRPGDEVVQIKVSGAPAGARILYDGAPVTTNPFPARQGRAVIPLIVEASGYEPFAVSVVPDQDRTIGVELKALVAEGSAAAGASDDSKAPAAPGSPSARRPAAAATTSSATGGPTASRQPEGFRKTFE